MTILTASAKFFQALFTGKFPSKTTIMTGYRRRSAKMECTLSRNTIFTWES